LGIFPCSYVQLLDATKRLVKTAKGDVEVTEPREDAVAFEAAVCTREWAQLARQYFQVL
jgi:hypothetical protein